MNISWPEIDGFGRITCSKEASNSCFGVNFPIPVPTISYSLDCSAHQQCRSASIQCPTRYILSPYLILLLFSLGIQNTSALIAILHAVVLKVANIQRLSVQQMESVILFFQVHGLVKMLQFTAIMSINVIYHGTFTIAFVYILVLNLLSLYVQSA